VNPSTMSILKMIEPAVTNIMRLSSFLIKLGVVEFATDFDQVQPERENLCKCYGNRIFMKESTSLLSKTAFQLCCGSVAAIAVHSTRRSAELS